jgi:type VI secretion system protein ImpL
MEQGSSFIASVQPYLPYVLIALAVLLVLALVVIVLVLRRAARSEDKPAEEGEEAAPPPPASSADEPADLDAAFRQAIDDLRRRAPGPDFRYRVPWVAMLGGRGTGKGALLANLLQRGQGGRATTDSRGCAFWFFDGGIVLDLGSDLVIRRDEPDERAWRRLLRLLVRHRPDRPLDGLILTVSATDLAGPNRLSDDQLAARGALFYERLSQLQTETGLRLPVYLVVTRCDTLPGFADLVQALPHRVYDSMLGWSNPAPADAAYSHAWIGEAFDRLAAEFTRLQLAVFADRDSVADPDGLFDLPDRIHALARPVGQLTNSLFRDTAYRESFFLRGIYLTADADPEAQPAPGHGRLPGAEDPALAAAADEARRPVFFHDLLFGKVFREAGLARPTNVTYLSRNRAIRAVQIGIAVTVLLGVLFLWVGANRLSHVAVAMIGADDTPSGAAQQGIVDAIQRGLIAIHEQSDGAACREWRATPGLPAQEVQESVRMLLNSMAELDRSWILLLFPSFWLTDVGDDIRATLGTGFSEVIVRGLCLGLKQRFASIIDEAGDDEAAPVQLAEPALNGVAYYSLRDLVFSLSIWNDRLEDFQNLTDLSNLDRLNRLTEYVFGFPLPQHLRSSPGFYRQATGGTLSRIGQHDLSSEARNTLRQVVHTFLCAVTGYKNCDQDDRGALFQALDALQEALERLNRVAALHEGLAAETELEAFRSVVDRFDAVETALRDPRVAWLGSPTADLGPDVRDLDAVINGLDMLRGRNAPDDQLMSAVSQAHHETRQALRAFQAALTGPLLARDGSGDVRLALSEEALQLQRLLTDLTERPFMATDVPAGQPSAARGLRWNVSALDPAVVMMENYLLFQAGDLRAFQPNIRPAVQSLALARLRANVMGIVAQAQVPAQGSAQPPQFRRAQELQVAVLDFRQAAPTLQRLIATFDQLQQNDAATTLRQVVVSQGRTLLQGVDALLAARQPYTPIGGGFGAWDGTGNPAFTAFGVSSQGALARYVAQQQEIVTDLAEGYAQPVVDVLVGSTVTPDDTAPPAIAVRWRSILQALQEFAMQRPGNPVTELNTFITQTLPEVTLQTCRELTDVSASGTAAQDFFTQRRIDLAQSLAGRCDSISGSDAFVGYARIRTAFNRLLADRFPFSGDPGTAGNPQVDLDSLRSFFRIYDENSEGLADALAASSLSDPVRQQAVTFVQQLADVRTLFAGWLDAPGSGGQPAFALDVTFRVNRGGENKANQIIDWALSSGGIQVDWLAAQPQAQWQHGEPISVTLRWATNAPTRPMNDPQQPALQVQGRAAVFSYSGPWALIALVRNHNVALSRLPTAERIPQVLEFRVPIQELGPDRVVTGTPDYAQAYIRVVVRGAPQPGSDAPPGRPIEMPTFPTSAPALP